MADRFDKFTTRAQETMIYAEEEAHALGHDYIGQEHILLGLMRDHESLAFKVLSGFGLTEGKVRAVVETIVGRGSAHGEARTPLTERAKKAIELGVNEARRMNHHYIGTEHLLLGMLREGEGVGAGALHTFGVTLDRTRERVTSLLSEFSPSPVASARDRLKGFMASWQAEKASKRYSLVLPESLFQQVQDLADRDQTTVVDVMRRFIKLGLFATQIQETPGSALIIREGDKERELLIL